MGFRIGVAVPKCSFRAGDETFQRCHDFRIDSSLLEDSLVGRSHAPSHCHVVKISSKCRDTPEALEIVELTKLEQA
jgi:hypothetical protein